MVLVDVLLAANLAVLGFLVIGDRSRQRRPRPVEVLAMARRVGRAETLPVARGPGLGVEEAVVIPFDHDARRRALQGSMARHPSSGRYPSVR